MSRSYKHTPIIGNCGGSDKQDKRIANRRERCTIRCIITQAAREADNLDSIVLPMPREISNNYTFNKDGRHWMNLVARPDLKKYMRK